MSRLQANGTTSRDWCLFSGQGQLLLAIAAAPERSQPRLAHDLQYAERRVLGFLHDLEAAGMLSRQRIDRHNRYTLHPATNARIPGLPDATVGDVLRGVQRPAQEAS
jgi:hypothetical protein